MYILLSYPKNENDVSIVLNITRCIIYYYVKKIDNNILY